MPHCVPKIVAYGQPYWIFLVNYNKGEVLCVLWAGGLPELFLLKAIIQLKDSETKIKGKAV